MSHIPKNLRTTLVVTAVVLLLLSIPILSAAPSQPTTSYLALVFRVDPSPTPTPLPVKALVNGGFEQGADVGWSSDSLLNILKVPEFARTGQWSASLGSSRKAVHWIEQNITVTAAAPYLVYWSRVYSEESKCTYDFGYVHSRDVGLLDRVDEFCTASQHEAYRKRSIDLRKWIGYTIDVRFEMSTDVIFLSTWHIDDVSMQAKP